MKIEIMLYGTRACGYGYLVKAQGTVPFGKNIKAEGRYPLDTMTGALWAADMDARDRGLGGKALVYTPGADRVAEVTLGRVPSYGWLQWSPVVETNTAHVGVA